MERAKNGDTNMKIVMSSGHGKYVRGAKGYIDEVDEARRVVEKSAEALRTQGVEVTTFHDDISTSQNENLNRIVDFHNSQSRDLDISVHFNAYQTTSKPMGTEVLYVSSVGQEYARAVVDDICDNSGLLNRGPKKRTDLFFLNNTNEPAILIETCFVDSSADVEIYSEEFETICIAIASGVTGEEMPEPVPPEPVPPEPEPAPPSSDHPSLKKGDKGPWVAYMQSLTPLIADGDFGSNTDSALRYFQQTHGLTADGICGQETWNALETYTPPDPPKPPPGSLTSEQQRAIKDIAANSVIAGYNWKDRGKAPAGYTQGVALAFATSYRRLMAGDSAGINMARANTNNDSVDALSWYASVFNSLGMDNSKAGVDTLRHLYCLLLGLGMRESSGRHCEGRDQSASNTSSDTAEAGLYQTSYNARSCSPDFVKLFDEANAAQSPCYLDTFEQGVSCSSSEWSCYGSGNGYRFQELCKSCPVFAVETCAIALRNLRQHYGPINRKEAEVRAEADQMFHQVQSYLEEMEVVV